MPQHRNGVDRMHIRRRQQRVFAEISPARFEFLALSGQKVLGREDSRPSHAGHQADWPDLVGEFESRLRQFAKTHALAGVPVSLVYTGPDTAAAVSQTPVTAGPNRAALAARLALAETVGFPLEQSCHAEIPIFRDRTAQQDEPLNLHTLAAADTDADLHSLARAVEQAGLAPERFLPAPALTLLAAARKAVSVATHDAASVVLWVGDHASAIAAATPGRLAFARLIPVGIETVVESLASDAAPADHPNEPSLDALSARELMLASGIPGPDGWNDPTITVDARAVLPLIQPALQRLVVEVKQSVRFGLPPAHREGARLTLAGPGARIDRLVETVHEGCGMAGTPSRSIIDDHATSGDIVTARVLGQERLPNLQTREIAEARLIRTTRRAVTVGAALAMLAIAGEATESWSRRNAAMAARDAVLATGVEQVEEAQRTRTEVEAAVRGLRAAEARIAAHLAPYPPLNAVLADLASRAPAHVRLREIDVRSDGDGVRCVLRGEVASSHEDSETDRFRAFTQSLQGSPLVQAASLGETRRVSTEAGPTLSFSMTLDLVCLPEQAGAVAAAEEPQ